MSSTEDLLKTLVEQQGQILSRLTQLEQDVSTLKHSTPKKTQENDTSFVIDPDFQKKVQSCLTTPNIIERKKKAQEIIQHLEAIELEHRDTLKKREKAHLKKIYVGLLTMLNSLGADTASVPLDIFSQEDILAQTDEEMSHILIQIDACTEKKTAKRIIDRLKSMANILAFNRDRFSQTEEVEKRIASIRDTIKTLSKKFEIITMYDFRKKSEVKAPTLPRGKYVENKTPQLIQKRINSLLSIVDEDNEPNKEELIADLDEIKESIAKLEKDFQDMFSQQIQSLEEKIDDLDDNPIFSVIEEEIEKIPLTDEEKLIFNNILVKGKEKLDLLHKNHTEHIIAELERKKWIQVIREDEILYARVIK